MGVVDEISWSFSRQKAWQICPRSVFFGSCWREEDEFATAPRLRMLKTPAMAAGIVVDRMVTEALWNLREGSTIPEDLDERGVGHLTEQFALSPCWATSLLERRYVPPEGIVLHGDLYEDPHPPEELQAALNQVREALRGFLESELLARLVRCAGRGFVLPPSRTPCFDLFGAKIYAGPDFFLVASSGRVFVADWKTGVPSPIGLERGWRQLGVYGLYIVRSLRLKHDALYAQVVWLRESPRWDPSPITPVLLSLCEEELLKGVGEFKSRLRRESSSGGATRHVATVEDFAARAAPSVCRRCCYLRLCPEGRRSLAAEDPVSH